MKAKDYAILKLRGIIWCLKHPYITHISSRKGAYNKYPDELVDRWFDNPMSYSKRVSWLRVFKCLVLRKEV